MMMGQLVFPDHPVKDEEDEELDEVLELVGEIEKHPMEKLTIDDLLKKDTESKAGEAGAARMKSVAFGSTQDRPMIPNKFPFSRSGITSFYRSTFPVGPGTHDLDKWTSNDYELRKRTSFNKKGWGFGILKEQRFQKMSMDHNIDPGHYQDSISNVQVPEQRIPPFGQSDPRFKKMKSITPGAGTYNIESVVGKQLKKQVISVKGKGKLKQSWSTAAKDKRKQERVEQYLTLYE